jgi:hypothetical protein
MALLVPCVFAQKGFGMSEEAQLTCDTLYEMWVECGHFKPCQREVEPELKKYNCPYY